MKGYLLSTVALLIMVGVAAPPRCENIIGQVCGNKIQLPPAMIAKLYKGLFRKPPAGVHPMCMNDAFGRVCKYYIPQGCGRPGERGGAGQRGEPGQRGERGPAGQDGPRAESGPPGPAGQRGEPRPAGQASRPGQRGELGPAGQMGSPVPRGARGEQGGSAGQTGEPGQRGERGPAGQDGPRAESRQPGPAGQRGEPGPAGQASRPGQRGELGPAGQGQMGPPVPRGARGEQGGSGGRRCDYDQCCKTDIQMWNYNTVGGKRVVQLPGSQQLIDVGKCRYEGATCPIGGSGKCDQYPRLTSVLVYTTDFPGIEFVYVSVPSYCRCV